MQPLRFNSFFFFQEFSLWWLQRYWAPSKTWWATSSPMTSGLAAFFGVLLPFGVTRSAQEQLRGWDQALQLAQGMCENQSALRTCRAAFPDQYIPLSNREIVTLVSKVMIIFAPFHLFDAAAVSIPAQGAASRAQWSVPSYLYLFLNLLQ